MATFVIKNVETLAWKIARRCRWIIQGCLREEEWADADQAFVEVIVEELATLTEVDEV